MSIQHIDNCTCGTCKKPFVQIHCHDSFSNLDGAAHTANLVKRAKELGHPALAITNHGNPAGLFQMYKECKKQGIRPILGLEFYITNDLTARVANKNREFEDRDFHQSVYIKDKEGYKNFNYLTYVSFTDGYYYKPRIDFDLLFSKRQGLMVTTSCIASKINNYLTADKITEAETLFKKFRDVFGDDFYGEIQFNELNDRGQWGIDQRRNNQFLIDMCQKYDVPIMIGGDVHYLDPEDNVLQDALINSKRQAKEGEDGFQIHARHLYFHDTSDYYELNKKFDYNYDTGFLEKCFENSVKFSEKATYEFETGKYHLPKIKTNGLTSTEYIEKATWEGLIKNIETERKYFPDKYTNEEIESLEKQAEYELSVFKEMGLEDYMLIVHDIIKFEKDNGIFVGAGRGSAAGSVVAWALGITGLNPMEHKLIFERFVNPNRKTMADIDWDSQMGGRDKVLEYLIETYGQDQVCNVATFGTYGPKSALQDMSRGLRKETGMDSILMRKISKLPQIAEEGVNKWKPKPGQMIEYFKNIRKDSLDEDVINWIDNNQDTIAMADKLIGQNRNLGTHAGGIVVTPEPIYNLIPVTRGSGNLITAFSEADGSSKDLSELGILKLDVLGLKTLNVLKECCARIQEDTGENLTERIFHLPLDDQKMIESFASGNNYGIFQMDKSAMFTSQFRNDGAPVDSFEDIVAINAMNRPGPLEKYLPKYGYWKAIDKGKIKITPDELDEVNKERYPFAFMEKTLEPTYGCLHEDELIYLPEENRYIPIKEVIEGQIIQSFNNNSKSNLTIDNGNKEVFEYTLATGYKIKLTEDHKIYTIEMGEIPVSIAYQNNYSIAIPKKLNSIEKNNISVDKARIIGMMLGDGCFCLRSCYNLTTKDQFMADNFKKLVEAEFPDTVVLIKPGTRDVLRCSVRGKRKRINSFKKFFVELGLHAKKSGDKFIPQIIFDASTDSKRSFLSGIFDTDGGLKAFNAFVKSKSVRLIDDLVLLCRQLGYLPTVYHNQYPQIEVLINDYADFEKYILCPWKKLNGHQLKNTYFKSTVSHEWIRNTINESGNKVRSVFQQLELNRRFRNDARLHVDDAKKVLNLINRDDKLCDLENFHFIKIKSAKSLGICHVYDLNINDEPWFIAGNGGLLVHNCLLYQEQFMQMICDVTGMTFGEADSFRRAIAWRPDNPKYYTVKGYFDRLEESMINQGYTKEDVDKFVKYCRDFMGYSFNRAHAVTYGYIAWQTLYLKVYYPAYFYAAMLNMAGDTDEVQAIIDDAKKNKIEVRNLSVTKSEYHTKAEGVDAIRLGYQLIKGMGDKVEDELKTLNLHKCRTIDEILQKPFKKINSTMLQNLIDLGCFDEFGVDRDLIIKLKELYKEPKIEKWFSRKRSPGEEKTMPEVLSETFDVQLVMSFVPQVIEDDLPHIKLVNQLTPHLNIETKETPEQKTTRLQKLTIKKELELLGFSISSDDEFVSFASSMKSGGFLPISEVDWEEDAQPVYFKIMKIGEAKTKTGKTYWVLTLNDGKKDYKVKMWRQNSKLQEGQCCVGALEFSEYGFTMIKCEVVK